MAFLLGFLGFIFGLLFILFIVYAFIIYKFNQMGFKGWNIFKIKEEIENNYIKLKKMIEEKIPDFKLFIGNEIFFSYGVVDKLNETEILEYILSKRDVDKVMKTTMTGPHRDKIYFVKDGQNFIPTASTGQRRLISLILRIAQATYYTEITDKKPILLMDDVLLELDPNKRQSVTALLPQYDQLFCTFLPGEPYERYKRSTTRIYKIENGAWFE